MQDLACKEPLLHTGPHRPAPVPRATDRRKPRLAIVVSHPIQYLSPWFAQIASTGDVTLKVFYLWDSGVQPTYDVAFRQEIAWDIPLLSGYDHCFVPNHARRPGTDHVFGLVNPMLVPMLADWQPDAILLFGYNFYSHLRLLLSPRLRRVPVLFRGDSHDIHRPPSLRNRLGRLARAVLFRRFAKVLAVGRANARYFRNAGVPERKIVLVPHCIDNDRFRGGGRPLAEEARRWRDDLGIAPGSFVFLFAGKFEPKKRPLDLLEAFQRFRASSRAAEDCILLFVGAGALEQDLRRRAGGDLGKAVFLAGFQNQTRMPMVYAAADVFVLPSFGAGETWGLAVNEAMNAGTPVIVSSHVGCADDLVAPGATGWCFDAGDVAGLAAALAAARTATPAARERIAEAARRTMDVHSYDVATSRLLAALEHVAPAHPRSNEATP